MFNLILNEEMKIKTIRVEQNLSKLEYSVAIKM